MLFQGIIILLANASAYPEAYCNGLYCWQYGFHQPHDNFEYPDVPVLHSQLADAHFPFKPSSYFNPNQLRHEPSQLSTPAVHRRPDKPKLNIVARFNGTCLILPGGRTVGRRELEAMIREVHENSASLPVLNPAGHPTSLVKYLKAENPETDPLVEQRLCVFDHLNVLPMPAALSVLSFGSFLEEQSKRPDSAVQLGRNEAKNVAAFLEYLARVGDIKLDCLSKMPLKYVKSFLPEAPEKIQDTMKLTIYGFTIFYKFLKPYLNE